MAMQHLQLAVGNKDTSVFTSIHNAIIALGFVQTSDTGQMNTSSPPAYSSVAATVYGYTVYRFDDAAQSTFPIFFKIKWRNGSTTNTSSFNHQISVGTASDGAGNITSAGGTTVDGFNVNIDTSFMFGTQTTTTITNLWDIWINSDDSHITMMYAPYGSSSALQWGYFSIDRFRDENGVANDHGFGFAASASASAHLYRGYTSTSGGYQGVATLPAFAPWYAGTTSQDGDNIPIFPAIILSPSVEHHVAFVGMNNFDVGMGQTFDVVHLGSSRRYMAWGGSKLTGATMIGTSATNGTLALLNE